jgi:signal transduction histidine kinase
MALDRRVRDRYGDALLAALIVVLGLLQTLLDNELSTAEIAANIVIAVGVGVLLVFRRRIPLLLLTLMFATALLEPLAGESGSGEFFGLFVLVAIYTAAAHTEGRRMWLAGAMTAALGIVVAITDPESLNVSAVIFFGMLFGVPWTVGRMVHHRRKREIALEERADALEREQEQRARAAVAEERQRIARELHDVVAHAISVIVVQARGGRRMLDAEPAEARGAFDTIERTGQEALGEMRRLLGLLRESADELALAPQPTLARLDDLVGQVRDAGLPVELSIEGEPTELPPGVDLSAYRIVQEALTNALKHAGPATARVIVRYQGDNLELEIADDGSGSTATNGAGHGLVGIKERVAMLGGEVETGGAASGGYAVRVRLPYASER